MGFLQLVLLNLQVWYGHFWVQLSLAKGGVSINKFLAEVKTNGSSCQDSFKDLHLPHPNSHCTPSQHMSNALLRRYAMP